MKKLFLILAILIPTTAFAAFPPCTTPGEIWREGNKTYECSSSGAWIEVDTDDHENIIRYGAKCDGVTDVSVALGLANAAAVVSGKRIYIPSCPTGSNYFAETNVSIAAPVEFASNALIVVDPTVQITFNNKSFTAPTEKIISSTAAIPIVFGTNQNIKPAWWGAVCDGQDANATINVAAIRSASDSLTSGRIVIEGDCRIEVGADPNLAIIDSKSNVDIVGVSPSESVIKMKASAGNYRTIFGLYDATLTNAFENISIRNLTIDHNASNNVFGTLPEYEDRFRATWNFVGGTNIKFENNIVRDTSSVVDIHFAESNATSNFNTNIWIQGNTWEEIGSLPNNWNMDASTMNIQASDVFITDNIMTGADWAAASEAATTAIETRGDRFNILGNLISQYSKGFNITGLPNDDSSNEQQLIQSNIVNVVRTGIMLWSQIHSPRVSGYGLESVQVIDNVFRIHQDEIDVAQTTPFHAGIAFFAENSLPMRDIIIRDNVVTFTEILVANNSMTPTTSGVYLNCSTTTDLSVENLQIDNNTFNNLPLRGIGQDNCNLKDMIIKSNVFNNIGQNPSGSINNEYRSAIHVGAESVEGTLLIEDNKIVDNQAVATTVYGIYLQGNNLASTDRNVEIRNTFFDIQGDTTAYLYDYYVHDAIADFVPYVEGARRGWENVTKNLPRLFSQQGTYIRDLTNNIDYIMPVEGDEWQNITYTFGYDFYKLLDNATGNESAVTINYTTDKLTSGDDTGLTINQTDTASPDSSYLIDAQVSGGTQFSVSNAGAVQVESIKGSTGGTILSTATSTLQSSANNITLGLQTRDFSTADNAIEMTNSTDITNSSGQFNGVAILPTYNQTGTAAGTDLLINRTETAVGSGAQNLIDAQVATVSQFSVDNAGEVEAAGISADGTGKAVCIKADGALGTCSTVPDGSGVCTCG